MVKFDFTGFHISFDFSFFAVLALFLTLDKTGLGLLSLAACALHELGHLAAIAVTRAGFCGIEFYGGGIRICNTRQNNAVILAGCAVNFALFVVFGVCSGGLVTQTFAAVNLLVGGFNLLPLGCLDGSRFFESVVTRRLPPVAAARVLKFAERTCAVMLAGVMVLLVFSGHIGLTSVFVVVYLLFLQM